MAKTAKEIEHIELTTYEQGQFDAVKTWTTSWKKLARDKSIIAMAITWSR